MASLFGKAPKPEKPPPTPNRTDSEVQAAADEQRRLIAQRTKATSWLTGGLGVPRNSDNYASAATKMLGGG